MSPTHARKRALDLFVAALVAPFALPVVGVSWLAVRLTDGRPGLYRQVRVGRDFHRFELLKIRTMSRAPGSSITVGHDPRITTVGAVLRRWKLDEVPQIWNVLRGDMSIVGPRPEIPEWVERFVDEYVEVLRVRPGLSDLASIVLVDEAERLAAAPDPDRAYRETFLPAKLALARAYVSGQSASTDLRIMGLTVAAIVRPGWASARAVRLGRALGADTSRGPIADLVAPRAAP